MIKVNSAGTRTMVYSKYVGGIYSYHERVYYGRGRVKYSWVTSINGQQVEFEINPCPGGKVGVHFVIDSSFDRVERRSKLKITKWLMAVWKEALALDIDRYEASAHATDGYGEYRTQLYSKFGWSVDDDASYVDEDGPVIVIVYNK